MQKMEKRTFRLTVPNVSPYWMPIIKNNRTVVTGIGSFFASNLEKRLNLNLEVTFPGGDIFGTEISPGNFTGCLGMLQRGEADGMLGLYRASEYLYQHFGFTLCVDTLTAEILSGPTHKINPVETTFLSSVKREIWMALILSWFVMTCVAYFLQIVEIRFMNSTDTKKSFAFMLLSFYGLLFEKGYEFLPTSTSRRLHLSGWLILSEVLMSVVGTNFAAQIMLPDQPERVDSLKDILKYNKLCPYIPRGIYTDRFLQESNKAEHRAFVKKMQHCKGNLLFAEMAAQPRIMEDMKEGRAAIIADQYVLGAFSGMECGRRITPLYLGKEYVFSTPMHFYYTKNLDKDIAEQFSLSITRDFEIGLQLRLTQIVNRRTQACYEESRFVHILSAIKFQDVARVFDVLFIGLAISGLVFLMEKLAFRFPNTITRHLGI